MTFPETNPNLLVRLRNRGDEQAWFEFVELYRPALLRLGRQRGMPPGDCEDLAQSVLLAIAGAIERWEPDPARGKFRTWLHTIARRKVIDALRQRSAAVVTGGSSIQRLLDGREAREEDSRLLRTELRRQIFQRQAQAVRDEFEPATWDCFWLVAVEGADPSEAARRTGKTVGAVYAAKARVARRLMQRIRDCESEAAGEDIEN
jgi:RNA polymerase sigma-70 factor (ECF subfamily)